MEGIRRFTFDEVQENFGESVSRILTDKKNELEDLEFRRCLLIDHKRSDPNLSLYLVFFDALNGYTQLKKEVESMVRINGIGGRRNQKERGMAIMPLAEVKQIPILDVFSFNKVKKTGRRTMVSCLFHDDNSPSALINTNNTYKCFSCGFAGDIVALTQRLYGYTFVDAVKHLNGYKK